MTDGVGWVPSLSLYKPRSVVGVPDAGRKGVVSGRGSRRRTGNEDLSVSRRGGAATTPERISSF